MESYLVASIIPSFPLYFDEKSWEELFYGNSLGDCIDTVPISSKKSFFIISELDPNKFKIRLY